MTAHAPSVPELVCPVDNSLLLGRFEEYWCSSCGRRYPVIDSVVCMLEKTDEFYEGAYENKVRYLPRTEKPWHVWPLWLLNSGYVWQVRKHVPAGAFVVELGCAGGVVYFGKRYASVACDLSRSSLKLADAYGMRVQADAAACIPFSDASVDAIVSSFFWEHISPEVKLRIMKECRRVLKPGGKVIFLYDVETENPLIAKYKRRDPGLYKRLFIDGDGHIGYQTPAENLTVFRDAGFMVLKHQGLEKTWLQHSSVYEKLSRFEGGRRLGVFARGLRSRLFYPYVALMRTIDTTLSPLLPDSWARIDLVVLQKPREDDPR